MMQLYKGKLLQTFNFCSSSSALSTLKHLTPQPKRNLFGDIPTPGQPDALALNHRQEKTQVILQHSELTVPAKPRQRRQCLKKSRKRNYDQSAAAAAAATHVSQQDEKSSGSKQGNNRHSFLPLFRFYNLGHELGFNLLL